MDKGDEACEASRALCLNTCSASAFSFWRRFNFVTAETARYRHSFVNVLSLTPFRIHSSSETAQYVPSQRMLD